MTGLFLTPLDVWLFRDGKPFDAHSDHRAQSLFPPYPTVIQGAIRSQELILKHVNLHDHAQIEATVGTAENYGALKLRGPFIAQSTDRPTLYLPQPADAYTVDKTSHTFRSATPPRALATRAIANTPTPCLIGLGEKPQKPETGLWLTLADLQRYLAGETVTGVKGDQLFERETRLGIARQDATRTTEEGMLYEVEFIRLQNGVGLYVEMAGYAGWPESGLLRIGGEGHGAQFTEVPAIEWPIIPEILPTLFKIYFATPTYFTHGWQPTNWDKFFTGNVELVAAAVSRYETIGGFDWASGQHKPARRYVPAGSVYYFRSQGTARLQSHLVQQAITDWGAEIGFGQIIISEWKEN